MKVAKTVFSICGRTWERYLFLKIEERAYKKKLCQLLTVPLVIYVIL
jgi:hypothetical protein